MNSFRSASNTSDKKYERVRNNRPNEKKNKEAKNLNDGEKEFLLNKEIQEALYLPGKKQTEIIKLLKNRNSDNFSVDSRQFKNGNSLLHEIAIAGKAKVLKKILDLESEPNVNIINDEGDTPIISVLKACIRCELEKGKRDNSPERSENESNLNFDLGEKPACKHYYCLKKLLDKESINVNIKNRMQLSALSYATMLEDEEKRKKYLKKVLFLQEDNKDVISSIHGLYQALKFKQDSRFRQELQQLLRKKSDLKINKFMFGDLTLLQAVSKNGMTDSANILLNSLSDTDINFAPLYSHKPIQLACIFGRVDILVMLKNRNAHLLGGKSIKTKHDRNLIHLTMKYTQNSKNASDCLRSLLMPSWESNLRDVINEADIHGRTPLHYAVLSDNDDCIVKLLENGALLNQKDKSKETPLMNISSTALKNFLDKQISTGRYPKKLDEPIKESRIIFNFEKICNVYNETKSHPNEFKMHLLNFLNFLSFFNFLNVFLNLFKKQGTYCIEENKEKLTLRTDFLDQIKNNNGLKKLLEHPVFSIAIYFKWKQVRKIFYLNIIMYNSYLLIFSLFLFLSKDDPELLFAGYNFSDPKNTSITLIILLNFFLAVFIFQEIFKIKHQGLFQYFSFLNVLRLINIFLALSCLNIYYNPKFYPDVKSISMLLTWLDLGFTAGKHHAVALYIHILKKTILRLLTFMALYFFILIGYALSFHLLFRSVKEDQKNPFLTVFGSFFKTIAMLNGLLSGEDILFHKHPYTSHFIFISYVILATLAMVSILAEIISSIKLYSEKPFLYRLIVQVDVIKHYEDNYPYTLYTVNRIVGKIKGLFCGNKHFPAPEKNDHLEMVLKGKKIELKHYLSFEIYPEEKLSIKSIKDSYKEKDVFDDSITENIKNIIKKKIRRDPEEFISSEEANELYFNDLIPVNRVPNSRIHVEDDLKTKKASSASKVENTSPNVKKDSDADSIDSFQKVATISKKSADRNKKRNNPSPIDKFLKPITDHELRQMHNILQSLLDKNDSSDKSHISYDPDSDLE